MKNFRLIELTLDGMDCTDCLQHLEQSLQKLLGVESVEIFWSTKKLAVCFDPTQVEIADIRKVLESSGYSALNLDDLSELSNQKTIEVVINGMDCSECARHVQEAILKLPGVESVDIFITSKKAVIQVDSTKVQLADINRVVIAAGYSLSEEVSKKASDAVRSSFGEGFFRIIVTI